MNVIQKYKETSCSKTEKTLLKSKRVPHRLQEKLFPTKLDELKKLIETTLEIAAEVKK